jgi:hypothetical protein
MEVISSASVGQNWIIPSEALIVVFSRYGTLSKQ